MKLGRLAAPGLVVLLGALPATAQVQESCTFDDATATVTAVMAPGGEATLEIVTGQIAFGADPQPCGGATNVNTDTQDLFLETVEEVRRSITDRVESMTGLRIK